ncbi:hypothetical protein EJ02DRAFT_464869 [Clathrospora elynae]|uniref:Uncharacterized protein n=1 Tax=Clathrospora elynae TaxID=706981 RepID=A0A6A5SUN0_9PLEO|nr:hypothetical protein EJ02DRAFT_464869 [Clathrospora elynae]
MAFCATLHVIIPFGLATSASGLQAIFGMRKACLWYRMISEISKIMSLGYSCQDLSESYVIDHKRRGQSDPPHIADRNPASSREPEPQQRSRIHAGTASAPHK